MVRATKTLPGGRREFAWTARFVTSAAVLCLTGALLLMAGCSNGGSPAKETSSTAEPRGANMAGAIQKVIIARGAIEAKPKPWVLNTPESAVRSYLDWISYAYRIGHSNVATPTMTGAQEVRFDSYNQMNLQNGKVIDQTLEEITFRAPIVKGKRALVPATEHWEYRYVSIEEVGKTIAGPYKASYETTYTVTKTAEGLWLVDSVAVKALGEVK